MRLEPDVDLAALARAVTAGHPIDWDAAESSAADDSTRARVRELRVIAGIAELHASLTFRTASPRLQTAAAPLPEEAIGTWGPLILLERIGGGAYGEVYRAWDARLDREVALKLLQAAPSQQPCDIQVVDEARLLARVRHANVVTVYGADRFEGRVGLWMELVKGQTLEQILSTGGPLSADEAATVGAAICRALSAVHAAGLLHRDLKAQNVMREAGGRIVLMDFGTGLETRDPSKEDEAVTLPGTSAPRVRVSGTPLYVAPEVLRREEVTARSDIYSVGVLLYHLVTGTYPVLAADLAGVRAAHAHGRRRLLRDARPELPQGFVQIVERALADDPAARFESAGALEAALSVPALRHPLLSPAPTTTAAPSSRRWDRRIMLAVAATGVLLIGGAALDVGGLSRVLPGRAGTSDRGAPLPDALRGLGLRQIPMPLLTFVSRPSPDGRHLGVVDLDGNLALFELATGQVRPLTAKGKSPEFAESSIAFSRDGRQLAYTWRTLDKVRELRVIGVDGRDPRVLLRRDDVAFPAAVQWTSDGRAILSALEMKGGNTQLALIDVESGAIDPISESGPAGNVTLSPDDRFVAFDVAVDGGARSSVAIVRVADGIETARVEHPGTDTLPVWTTGGDILFASDRSGSIGLWSVRVEDGVTMGVPRGVHRDIGRYFPLGLTDTGLLFFQLQTGLVDVYTARMDPDAGTLLEEPQQVAPTSVGNNMSSSWSPDGRVLAYVAARGLPYRIRRRLVLREPATGRERLLQPALLDYLMPQWSPDGTRILLRGIDLNGRAGLFVVDVASGHTENALPAETPEPAPGAAIWSPDGHALWFNQPNVGLWAHDLRTGARTTLLDYRAEGLSTLEWNPGAFRPSPDGLWLAFVAFARGTADPTLVLRVKSLDGGPSRELVRTAADVIALQPWAPDGRHVLMTRTPRRAPGEPAEPQLWRVPLDGSPPTATGFAMRGLRYLDLSPDGTQLTFTAGAPLITTWMLEGAADR